MVELEGVTHFFGINCVLDQVSFSIKKGSVTGFLGPNGAGKSTTMNILSGYMSPTKGRVSVCGIDLTDHPMKAKSFIGYLPDRPPLYDTMLVDEYLDFVCAAKGLPRHQVSKQKEELYESLSLSDVRRRLIRTLSRGYRQRVGLAQALCGSPQLVILDEPMTGLDPRQIAELRQFIVNLRPRYTILISSHRLPEVESVCDSFVIIHQGRIVAYEEKERLIQSVADENCIVVRARVQVEELLNILENLPQLRRLEVRSCDEEGACEVSVFSESDFDLREDIFWSLSKARIALLGMVKISMSLEDVYLRLTHHTDV